MSSLQQRQTAKKSFSVDSNTREETKQFLLGVGDILMRFISICTAGAVVSLFFCTILGLSAGDFFKKALKPEYQRYFVHDEKVTEDPEITPELQESNAIARKKRDDPETPEREDLVSSITEYDTGAIVEPIKGNSLLDAAYITSLFTGSWYGLSVLRWPLFIMVWLAFVLGRLSRIRRQVYVVHQAPH